MAEGTTEDRPDTTGPPVPATFYTIQAGNDVYWRVQAPARAIGAKVCVIPEPEAKTALIRPNDGPSFPWTLREDKNGSGYVDAVYPNHEGPAAVWTRPDPPRAVHAKEMRSQGILTVGEVDDNYMSHQRFNIFQRQHGFDDKGRDAHIRSLASMGRIVFSTPLLRDMYFRYMKEQFNVKNSALPEMFVCGNHIDVADWPEPVPRENRLRVGWMGSPSHVWDVDLAWPALMLAQSLGCETVMIGYDPRDPWGVGPSWPKQNHASKERIRQWKRLRFRFIPWVSPAEYQRPAMPLDIGLCPLLTNVHTLGKSDIKALEYGISGAAVVAQDNEVYNQTLVHGETALLVKTPEEMAHAVSILAHDENLRMRLVNNLRQYVYEERGLRQMREEWTAAVSPS